uniref:NADH-ubiquinone oxidoreductase chain 5 n=1 Tax=Crypsis chinensis TaxID=2984370 RepID=A0A978D6G0_9CUCU|nr:NADH dehydrogenase subunit 5 [Crypsis chinensis]UYB79089.1 NADH dehydrogenase subunit 5 [Crypsis chinensis]
MNICLIYSLILFLMSLLSFFGGLSFMFYNMVWFFEVSFISVSSSLISMTILLDWMSLIFMSFVLFISSMVIFYSLNYMSNEKSLDRFIMLVVLFVVSMMFLILSPNLISILLGWDGLGLISYCLVIYYQNIKSYNAGMVTALMNRVGDVALLMAIAWMLNYGSWNYVFYMYELKSDYIMGLISGFVVLAAMTKSAQIPFSSWLPAAMAAPTPVSSLVHSSTLVTAGVYLLIRFENVLGSFISVFLLYVGCMTMFMAGLGASVEIDLKKIIALSTLSQLGLMMSMVAMGGALLAFYHLLTHALFKALLFMCAGNIIHNLNDCQDIRCMGGLASFMPLTSVYFNISNLSLCGLPFLSGFYSKDLIVEVMSLGYVNMFIYMIFYLSLGLTVFYSFRLTYFSFLGVYNASAVSSISDGNMIMKLSMGGLIVLVVFMGSLLSWLMFGHMYIVVLPILMKLMSLIFVFSGMWLGLEFSKLDVGFILVSSKWFKSNWFISGMWNLSIISVLSPSSYSLNLGSFLYKSLDQGWTEYMGAQKIYLELKESSLFFRILMFNNIKVMLFFVLFWLIVIMIFV